MLNIKLLDSIDARIDIKNVAENNRGKVFSIANLASRGDSNASIYLRGKRSFDDSRSMRDGNFTVLSNKLAKLDPTLYTPETNTTYKEDVEIDVGGGFVDYVEWLSVDWAAIANLRRNGVGNNANTIPHVNAAITQNIGKVYTFEIAYDFGFIELEKLKTAELTKSIEDIYKDIVVASWEYFVDDIVYLGGEDKLGLFNHEDIVPTNVTTLSKAGIEDGSVSDTAIVGFINGILVKQAQATNLNKKLLPDTILCPQWFIAALVNRFSNLYTSSLYEYILANNYGKTVDPNYTLHLVPREGLDDLGDAGVGRIVAYKKDKKYVKVTMPYPCQHFITLPNMERMAYTTAFAGQVSEIQMPYNHSSTDVAAPVQYWDLVA